MNNRKRKTFRTNEFAAVFGIKKDTLLYYDRIGLFSPSFRTSNGYRYYTDEQTEILSAILSLRSLNVPIQMIQEYFTGRSPENFISLIDMERIKADEEIRRLENIKRNISGTEALIRETLLSEKDKVFYLDMDESFIIESRYYDVIADDSTWNLLYKEFITEIDADTIMTMGSRLSAEDVSDGIFNRIKSVYTTSYRKSRSMLEKGLYAVIYVKGPYSRLDDGYRTLIDSIKENGYRLSSDAFEDYVISGRETDDPEKYITRIRIRVER